MQAVLLVVGVSVAYGIYYYVSNLLFSIGEAKRSGFNYVVPCDPISLPWQLTHRIWIRIIKLFPESCLMMPDMPFRTGFERFKRHGEAFLVVSPRSGLLHLANAEMIRHVTMRREQFPKWTATYAIMRQFGENGLTSEGQVWRTHRKVTSASFNERNAALVFREAIVQTQGMIHTWTRQETLRTIEHDTMRLALNIIGYVGFGLRLLWPGQTLPADSNPTLAKYDSLEAPAGHKISFVNTMATVLENILLLLVTPKWLLRILPFRRTQAAADAYRDYIKYMDEMKDKIDESLKGDRAAEGMDLMCHLVRTTYGGGDGGYVKDPKLPVLSRDEIIGNAFIMFVAGHETTANTLHFTMVDLATNPSAQRKLQRDIDDLVGDSDSSSWDYESLANGMTASMIGACMYETLRIMPPAAELPKEVSSSQDQPISMDGRPYLIPRGTIVSLAGVSVHQNPRYWPHGPSRIRPGHNDLRDFRPDRWFQNQQSAAAATTVEAGAGADTEDFGGPVGPDTNAQLFRPERGAYIPFSDGARSCLGRRIAQVEIIAALAVFFHDYSLELAVDGWAADGEVEAMSWTERRHVYQLAQQKSRWTMLQASSLLTLKLHGERRVPVRMRRRGEERFVSWIEDYP